MLLVLAAALVGVSRDKSPGPPDLAFPVEPRNDEDIEDDLRMRLGCSSTCYIFRSLAARTLALILEEDLSIRGEPPHTVGVGKSIQRYIASSPNIPIYQG